MGRSKNQRNHNSRIMSLRYEIAKRLGYLKDGLGSYDDPLAWWRELTNDQKAEINGIVTRMMVAKAEIEMMRNKVP